VARASLEIKDAHSQKNKNKEKIKIKYHAETIRDSQLQ
jgi:hypothetical protein